jgi:hypothetical protein
VCSIATSAFLGPRRALLCRGGMRRRSAATHDDAGLAKLLAHGGPGNAQLGTDLAQAPTLGVQVGCTFNVHRATLTSLRLHAPPLEPWVRPEGLSLACRPV